MRRSELEHVIRAAASIANTRDIVVIGSQAILGQFPDADEALLRSVEADVFPREHPEDSDLIDGSIGELSPFHQTFGYYAHGVSPETACLPAGWENRLVAIQSENTGSGVGWCLDVHDLAISKLVAGREKDIEFIRAMMVEKMVNIETLRRRLSKTTLESDRRQLSESRLAAL